jgi:hypothetical protein
MWLGEHFSYFGLIPNVVVFQHAMLLFLGVVPGLNMMERANGYCIVLVQFF